MDVKNQETGFNVVVSVKELITAVHEQLDKYHQLLQATGVPPVYNPYQSPVYYTDMQGKVVKVPPEIHQRAINSWQAQKQTRVPTPVAVQPVTEQVEQHVAVQTEEPTKMIVVTPKPKTQAQISKKTKSQLHWLIVVALICVVIYCLYKVWTYKDDLIETTESIDTWSPTVMHSLFQPHHERFIVISQE